MPLNLPNLLTWLRILLIPLFVGIFYLPDGWVTASEAICWPRLFSASPR